MSSLLRFRPDCPARPISATFGQVIQTMSLSSFRSPLLRGFPSRARLLSTLVHLEAAAVDKYGERPAFGTHSSGKYSWMTYQQWQQHVNQLQAVLTDSNIQQGDRVGLICKNRWEWAATAFAAYRLGAMIVPMYESQYPEDWMYIVDNSGAKVIVATNAAASSIERMLTSASVERAILLDNVPSLAGHDGCIKVDFDVQSTSIVPSLPEMDPTLPCQIIYTSGTTGKPKGVVLTHNNIVSNLKAVSKMAEGEYSTSDRHLSFLPWAHVYGQTVELYNAMYHGASLGLARSSQTLMEDIQHVKPTVLVSVPTLFQRIYDGVKAKVAKSSPVQKAIFNAAMGVALERRETLNKLQELNAWQSFKWRLANRLVFSKIQAQLGGHLRFALSGGAALDRDIQRFFGDLGIPVLEGYGLTETAPVVAAEHYALTETLQTGLQALENVTILICDGNHTPLKPGQDGEICVVGPNVMQGYWNNPEATAAAIIDIGGQRAFLTGDKGYIEPDTNQLRITGRIKDQYKLSNGKFVQPDRIEAALLHSGFVQQALVYGKDKPHNVALLVLDANALATRLNVKEQDLATILRKHRAKVDELVRNAVNQANEEPGLKGYERVKDYYLLDKALTVEDGFLTQKLSIKRPKMLERYESELLKLYHQE
eukprot:TRINITY_DN7388_c0_g1_i1.p1 TRINITY_DN7388_c0_g1~~TRINITY_DN7388_c0_g1_i1.p1  ORF type:complete len:652 (+),score=132.66 TRINITY_DN7388_c0_g1_i1:121-2076(+)